MSLLLRRLVSCPYCCVFARGWIPSCARGAFATERGWVVLCGLLICRNPCMHTHHTQDDDPGRASRGNRQASYSLGRFFSSHRSQEPDGHSSKGTLFLCVRALLQVACGDQERRVRYIRPAHTCFVTPRLALQAEPEKSISIRFPLRLVIGGTRRLMEREAATPATICDSPGSLSPHTPAPCIHKP
jgi:hypothetical protein